MIHLTNTNYSDYLPLDVVAFDYASSGAMGEGGAINIYTKDAQHYHLNYAYEPWTEEQLLEVLPLLSKCDFALLGDGSVIPSGFVEIYMGAGNTLVIPESYKDRLVNAFNSLPKDNPRMSSLYQVRSHLIVELIKEDLK